MSVPVLLSPIQFTTSYASKSGNGTPEYFALETSEKKNHTAFAQNTREEEAYLDDDDDDETIQLEEHETEYSYLDAAAYPAESDVRSRLLLDLYQLAKDGCSALLNDTLAFWNKNDSFANFSREPFFIDLLCEEYEKPPRKLESLKGEDRPLVEAVKGACEKAGSVLLLGVLERRKHGAVSSRHESWSCPSGGMRLRQPQGSKKCQHTGQRDYNDDDMLADHEIGEVLEDSFCLTKVTDLEGRLITGQTEISEDNILQQDPFDDREPDEEEYPAGYDERSGDLVTHWFRSTVMIIVRRDKLLGLLDYEPGWYEMEQETKHENLYTNIQYFVSKMTHSNDVADRDYFAAICTRILEHNEEATSSTDLIPDWFRPALLAGAIRLKDAEMCERIMYAFDPIIEQRLWKPIEQWIVDEAEVASVLRPDKPVETEEQLEAFLDELRSLCSSDRAEPLLSKVPVAGAYRVDEGEAQRLDEGEPRRIDKHTTASIPADMTSQGNKRKAAESIDELHSTKRVDNRA